MQKTHPEQLRMELQQEVTDREIQDTLFFTDGDKAHGPDGYTVHFFKKAWHIVKGDVLADIHSFFFSSKLLGEVNATIITLVPKVPNYSTMSVFRLFSCCNIIYKCITKLLANRLKACLDILMSPTQTAFIPGRSIK